MNEKPKTQANFLFEVSWEVCNKIGGIWTVLKSKARPILDYYGENYCLIGPYFPEKCKGEFEEAKIPKEWEKVFLALEKEGIKAHFGYWLIGGNPKTILVDFSQWLPQGNQIKKELWENFKIDSFGSSFDYTEPLVWGWAVGKILEKMVASFLNQKIVGQFHEWLSGGALLYLKKQKVPIASVFTTHATILGRTLAGNDIPLDLFLGKIDPAQEAYKYGIQAKHQLEKASALNCDIFSTVSHITALESESILGKYPDVLLPNGLDTSRFPTIEEVSIKHRIERDKIREFLFWYFFPYYSFDLKNTLFYFTIGRYELRNKGVDVFIKALSELNKLLKKDKSKKIIVAFFWIPTQVQGIKRELMEAREVYFDMKEHLESITEDIEDNLLKSLVAGDKIEKSAVFENKEETLSEIKNKILRFKKQGSPPLCTHNLADENDAILKMLQENGLNNDKEDKVKAIFYPIYLNGADGILNMTSDEATEGSHLGVFPSLYEPWGYTALEAAASGVAAITTDLGGFGRFCLEYTKGKKQPGIFVLERAGKSDKEIVEALSQILYDFAKFSAPIRVENKLQARKIAALADWEVLAQNYIISHNKAIEKAYLNK